MAMRMPEVRLLKHRRHEPRYRDVQLAALVNDMGKKWPVTVTNVSDAGVGFLAPVPSNPTLSYSLSLVLGEEIVTTRLYVVRCERHDWFSFDWGCLCDEDWGAL